MLEKAILDVVLSENSSEKNRLMAYTLRVLSLYSGTLWFKEIANEIKGFRSTVERDHRDVDFKVLREAIDELKKLGIVNYTIKLRSILGMNKPVEEPLINLVDMPLTLNVLLSNDVKFRMYIAKREKALEGLRRAKCI